MPYRPGVTLDEVVGRLRTTGGPPRRAWELREMVDPEADTRRADGDAPGWSDFPGAGTYADAVAWVGIKIAQALSHAHGRGFYHRDVKPENVLLNGRDGPQLIDFNLAHDPAHAGAARSAHRGGTLPYLAREHLEAFLDPSRWEATSTAAPDLFALGLVLRELLTLEPPARPADRLPLARAINAMVQVRQSAGRPIRKANRRVPHALAAIVEKCLAASAADRYASAADLAADLALYLGRRPLLYARNPSPTEIAFNGLRRARVPLAAAAVVVAIAIPCLYLYLESHGALDIPASPITLEMLEKAVGEEVSQPEEADKRIEALFVNPADAINGLKSTLRRHPDSLALRLGLAKALMRGPAGTPRLRGRIARC